MRKRGRPNPDQKFFALVVTIAARAGVSMRMTEETLAL